MIKGNNFTPKKKMDEVRRTKVNIGKVGHIFVWFTDSF